MLSHKEPDKARRYLDLLDTARCSGRWEDVPELARKVEKHVPRRKCLTLTARCEYQVATSQNKRTITPSIANATPTLSSQIPPLLEAVEKENSFPEDAFEARVCLGWLHWSNGEPGLALSRIPPEVAQISQRLAKDGRILSGWTNVCIVKAAYIRGVSQEHAGSFRDALETYESLLPHISNTAPGMQNTPEHQLWTERLLSRYCVLVARHVKSKSQTLDEILSSTPPITTSSILPPFRAWAKLLVSESEYGSKPLRSFGSETSRRQIWQLYYTTLSILLQCRALYDSDSRGRSTRGTTQNFDTRFVFDSKLAHTAELKRVETAYEKLLLSQVGFPKANEANVDVENWTDQVMSNWSLITGPDWEKENLEKGGKSAVSQRVLAMLYRAATRSFHSTRILRHLFTVHTAVAEFDLADRALNSYLEIVTRGRARVEKSGQPEIGLDEDSTVFWTAAAGIRTLCVHGGRKEAERSQAIVDLVAKWLERHRTDYDLQPERSAKDVPNDLVDQPSKPSTPITADALAAAHRALGLSRMRWSRLTHKTSERAELLEQAVSDLRTAVTHGGDEDSIVETSYYLALALAEKRDIDAAIQSVKNALSVATAGSDDSSDDESTDEQHSPSQSLSPWKRRLLFRSWHLLSLLLTAKQNFDAAVNSCEAALELYGGSSMLFRDQKDTHLLTSLGVFERSDIAELKMTQLALSELIDGPEEAVNGSGDLLALYAKLFRYTEPPVAKTTPESTVSPPESMMSAPRSLRASVFGRSEKYGSNRKSQLAMGMTGSNSTDSQISPLGTQTAPTIQVTSEGTRNAASATDNHHHIFRHGSKKLHKRDSRKTMSSLRNGRNGSPARLSTAKDTDQPNFNLPTRSRPSTANSSNQRSTDSNPYASDEVGVAVSHNGPSTNNGPPAGLDGASSAVTSLPPTSQNKTQSHPSSFPKPALEQDPDSKATQKPPPPAPEPIFDPTNTKRHSLTLLIKVWLITAGLYRRASMPTDAAASVAEADTHVRTIEALVTEQNGSSNATLKEPGWGGAKAVAELWGDVYAERAMQHLSKEEKWAAEEAYEQALLWWPDHTAATVGLCDLLLDAYEASRPKPEPKPSLADPLLLDIHRTLRTPIPTQKKKKDPIDPLSCLAARDRAYGLLAALTRNGQGWDSSEAWMGLARAHELSGQVDKAKEALWWVVELEEGRGIREWSVVGGW